MAAAHLETSKTSLPRVLPRALAPSAPAGPRIAAPRVAILSSPRAEPQCGLSGSAAVQHAAATSDWPASSHTSRLHTPANKGVGAQRRAFRVACALPASNRASVQANATANGGLVAERGEAILAAEPATPVSDASGDPANVMPAQAVDPSIRVPRSIHDISNGDHILGFGAQLGEDHPVCQMHGFHDEEYKQRRSSLADLAKTHVIGQPIPEVEYAPAELETWRQVLNTLAPLYPTHACSHFLRSFPHFGFSPDRIPQLEELSQVLLGRTGWQIRPVAGLLHPRDFLNGLAFRYFHSTQYIRHGSQPMYTPEPDICHELLGHVPMLADPEFADLAQALGQASLGATEKEIWHLTKLYWYTVEFGTILEEGEVKAFGAGVLSSYGELAYMRDGAVGPDGVHRKPSFVELDPFAKLPKMSYKDGFQQTYFLCSSFHDVSEKLRAYARSVEKTHLIPSLKA